MADDKFETNLLRMICAQLFFSLALSASRELYGKSYFSLGVAEKLAIDQMIWQQVSTNYQGLTPQALRIPTDQKPVGFHTSPTTEEEKK
jgi:hypothetical protein